MNNSTLYIRILYIFFVKIVIFLVCQQVHPVEVQAISSQNKNIKVGQRTLSNRDKPKHKNSEGKLENFNIEEYSENGSKKWEVKAATAKVYKKIVKLTNVKGFNYGRNSTVKIRAKEGKYNKKSQNLHLNNDVVTTTSDGIKMFTEELNWLTTEEKAYTEERVLVNNDRIEISGKGAETKPDLKKIRFERDVVTNVKPDTIIVCKGPLKINYKSNIAVFNNNVVVKDKKGKIWADKMTVYFNDKKKVKRIIAEGNVRVKRGKDIIRSKRAKYIKEENKVIFTGSPKLTIYPEEESKRKSSN